MRAITLKKAIAEAKRFVEIAETAYRIELYADGTFYHIEKRSKESAACKRASMDLTRILADLRQGR